MSVEHTSLCSGTCKGSSKTLWDSSPFLWSIVCPKSKLQLLQGKGLGGYPSVPSSCGGYKRRAQLVVGWSFRRFLKQGNCFLTAARFMALPPDRTHICVLCPVLLPPPPVLLHQQMLCLSRAQKMAGATEQQSLALPNRHLGTGRRAGYVWPLAELLPKLQLPAIPD